MSYGAAVFATVVFATVVFATVVFATVVFETIVPYVNVIYGPPATQLLALVLISYVGAIVVVGFKAKPP
jgi:hypothetical protein